MTDKLMKLRGEQLKNGIIKNEHLAEPIEEPNLAIDWGARGYEILASRKLVDFIQVNKIDVHAGSNSISLDSLIPASDPKTTSDKLTEGVIIDAPKNRATIRNSVNGNPIISANKQEVYGRVVFDEEKNVFKLNFFYLDGDKEVPFTFTEDTTIDFQYARRFNLADIDELFAANERFVEGAADISANLNIKQLAKDIYGPDYSLDRDGQPNLESPVVKQIAQLKTEVDAHVGSTSAHSATSSAAANRIVLRDAHGRAKVAAPEEADDIARKAEVDVVQDNLTAHESATNVHDATSSATANRIIIRDASGRAKVAAPAEADDIARKAEVDIVQDSIDAHINDKSNPHNVTKAQVGLGNVDNVQQASKTEFDAHVGATSVHSATPAATANRIMMRDASGRAKVTAPAEADDIARKAEVDAVQSNLDTHTGATLVHGATSAAVAGRIIIRDTNGRAKVAAPVESDDIARKAEIDQHANDNTKHITEADRTKWNAVEDKLDKSGGTIIGSLTVQGKVTVESEITSEDDDNVLTTKKYVEDLLSDFEQVYPAHGYTHALDGTDPITPNMIGLGNVDNVKQASKQEFDEHKAESASDGVHGAGQANGLATLDSGGNVPESQLPIASTSKRGIVQLSTSTTSTSTSLAATASAVKAVNDALTSHKADGVHQKLIIPSRTSDPASPVNGEIWFRSDL